MGGSVETCAWTMRQPSARRTHTWLWRPRANPVGTDRSNSRVMLAKSWPKVTISSLLTMRERFDAGRALRNAANSSGPWRVSPAPKRMTCGPDQNMAISLYVATDWKFQIVEASRVDQNYTFKLLHLVPQFHLLRREFRSDQRNQKGS